LPAGNNLTLPAPAVYARTFDFTTDMAQTKPINTFSLEQSFARIKEIQQLLQQGELPFEDSMKLFAEAESLIHQSQQYLNQAEITIQNLMEEDKP
jgi:exodeoxyribonuclease VII small subunit